MSPVHKIQYQSKGKRTGTSHALCSDAKKQEICIKVMTRLETEIRGLQVEYSKVNTEILNLDKFIDYAFTMRSNLFNLWELQGLEGRRRLQKLVFPDGFIYDKNNEHIEPKTVNQFFLLNYSFPTNNGDKKRETNSENHRSSLQVLEAGPVSYTHLRAHETSARVVCRRRGG